ncbi:hypothetical protein LX32DRAFT_377945 [Colletotrichum zoysiae]|uniref:Uncharacterized protein n=1 Tax=Colletotrichum zoysiae TaxID=1216348 RepID=A0AAD9HJ99_9PEZI|nr:hypothetical protein LX32DRAFT_377945 [Colletotrichum zoysiae]
MTRSPLKNKTDSSALARLRHIHSNHHHEATFLLVLTSCSIWYLITGGGGVEYVSCCKSCKPFVSSPCLRASETLKKELFPFFLSSSIKKLPFAQAKKAVLCV